MKKQIIYILLAFTLTYSSLWAESCSKKDYDKAEYFSEQAAQRIVSQYGGGKDIRSKLRSCNYNSYSNEFKTTINIYWNGSIFSSNNYNVDGELKFRSDGTLISFAKSYENSAVKDLNFFIGSVVVFAALANEGSN